MKTDYYFLDSPVPYSLHRSREKCARLMLLDIDKFGKRAEKGGDLFEMENDFLRFAASHSVEDIEKRFEILNCPKIYADGAEDISKNVKIISGEWKKICQS